jgi:hypothetical protein
LLAGPGERWRGAFSNAESGYAHSPEIPGLVFLEQYLRANGWENAIEL